MVVSEQDASANSSTAASLNPIDLAPFEAMHTPPSIRTRLVIQKASLAESLRVLDSTPIIPEQDGTAVAWITPVVEITDSRLQTFLIHAVAVVVLGFLWILSFRYLLPHFPDLHRRLFGLHYIVLVLVYLKFALWRVSLVVVPDGCQGIQQKSGRLIRDELLEAGRHLILSPFIRVSHLVNTKRVYPYNIPIREAPTQDGVRASVDLFVTFRIKDAMGFYTAHVSQNSIENFAKKLRSAAEEITRALIYEHKAETIYDIGEPEIQQVLDSLNREFEEVIQFTSASITFAAPSNPEYRRNLATPEYMKAKKEAQNAEHQLLLEKSSKEGKLHRKLTELHREREKIQSQTARYRAQVEYAEEEAINRAKAIAHKWRIEAKSEARERIAELEAQATDIKALAAARYPEVVRYQLRKESLKRIRAIAEKLPQVIHAGPIDEADVDFLSLARRMLGIQNAPTFTTPQAREQTVRILEQRIRQRQERVENLYRKICTKDEEDEG